MSLRILKVHQVFEANFSQFHNNSINSIIHTVIAAVLVLPKLCCYDRFTPTHIFKNTKSLLGLQETGAYINGLGFTNLIYAYLWLWRVFLYRNILILDQRLYEIITTGAE